MDASVVVDYTAHLDAKPRLNGPDRQDITIIGLEPHPEDKKNGAYDKVTLSDMPNMDE